jgi:isopentenyl phosphate kinase
VINPIQIINGLEEGNITQALKGEGAGTTVYKE